MNIVSYTIEQNAQKVVAFLIAKYGLESSETFWNDIIIF